MSIDDSYEQFTDANEVLCNLYFSVDGIRVRYSQGGKNEPRSVIIPIENIIGMDHETYRLNDCESCIILHLHVFIRGEDFKVHPCSRRMALRHKEMTFKCRNGNRNAFNLIHLWRKPILDITSQRFTGKILIIINSFGGGGRALKKFDGVVKPILTAGNVRYDTAITQRENHAVELSSEYDIATYKSIAIMSGDGLIFQVINGLMRRPDWAAAIKTPLMLIPGGTANALAGSVLRASNEFSTKDPLRAATSVLMNHTVSRLDIVLVETPHERLYSAVVFAWGMIADINNEALAFRWMGSSRLIYVAMKKLMNLSEYAGRVDFLPHTVHTGADTHDYTTSVSTTEPPKPRHLRPIGEPVPSTWECREGKFIGVMSWMASNLTDRLCFLPEAKLDDGVIHLIMIKAGASVADAVDIFWRLGEPDFRIADQSFVEVRRVVAFRITPKDTRGALCVDGEPVKFGTMQGEILPGMARAMIGNSNN